MKTVGSRAEVWHGTAKKTSGGLLKKNLKKNKRGRIVSKKMSNRAKKEKRLEKAGYKTKKGKFTLFKAKKRGGMNSNNNETNGNKNETNGNKNETKGNKNETNGNKNETKGNNGKKDNSKKKYGLAMATKFLSNENTAKVATLNKDMELRTKPGLFLKKKDKLFNIILKSRFRNYDKATAKVDEILSSSSNSNRKELVNAQDRNYNTLLHRAIKKDNEQLVDLLLDSYKADPNLQDRNGKTPLHYAVTQENDYIVGKLLSKGANPNIKDDTMGWTPLHYAAAFNYFDIFRLLLDAGADPNIKDNRGKTVFEYLRKNSNIKTLLKESKLSKLKSRATSGIYANKILSFLNNHNKLRLSKARTKFNRNTSLIGKADGPVKLFEILSSYSTFNSSSKDSLKELIKKGVNINTARDTLGYTPLSYLSRQADIHIEPMQILLEAGADPNIKQKNGDTPLLVWMKNAPYNERGLIAVELLLKAGADPNIPDKDGNTPLHLMKDLPWPRRWSRTELFDLLIDFGADTMAKNNEGETPLQVAEKQYEGYSTPKFLRKLRNPKAKPLGTPPVLLLTDAAGRGKIEDIKGLIDAGVDINAVDYKGNTALHSAVDYFEGNPETIELLIKLGADKNKKDRKGKTPFEKLQDLLNRLNKPEAFREILNLLKPSNSNNSAKSKGGSKKRRKRKTTKRKTTKRKTTKRKTTKRKTTKRKTKK